MARILGVNQKTAWKLGRAIRELMDDRDRVAGRLSGVIVAQNDDHLETDPRGSRVGGLLCGAVGLELRRPPE